MSVTLAAKQVKLFSFDCKLNLILSHGFLTVRIIINGSFVNDRQPLMVWLHIIYVILEICWSTVSTQCNTFCSLVLDCDVKSNVRWLFGQHRMQNMIHTLLIYLGYGTIVHHNATQCIGLCQEYVWNWMDEMQFVIFAGWLVTSTSISYLRHRQPICHYSSLSYIPIMG